MPKRFEKKNTETKEIKRKEGAIRIAKTVGGVLLGTVGLGITIVTKGKFKGPTKL